MHYTYNLSGALIEETYPSGRVVRNTIDDVGRLSMVQASKNASSGLWSYADSFSFNSAGAVTRMQLGNGTWEKTDFNSRLQPTAIALGSTPGTTNLLNLTYEYNTETSGTPNPDNNGNVLKQTIVVPSVGADPGFTGVQTYSYDQLNRIDDASEHIDGSQNAAWAQDFTYDRYGNRNFNESTTTTLTKTCGTDPNYVQCAWEKEKENPEIDKYTNRIKELQPDGDQQKDYEYDAAGNTILDPEGKQFFYDGENKQIRVENINDEPIGEYVFDGDGKRVMKRVHLAGGNIETTVFVYDAGGKLVAEYSTTVASQATAQVSYLTNDHLGSPRITTDKNGKVYSKRDFMPFGEELTASTTAERIPVLGYGEDTVRQKFTGYERDEETGQDYAKARVFKSELARFSSADPFNVVLESKATTSSEEATGALNRYLMLAQQWNRYSYAINNPIKYIDPSGATIVVTGSKAEKERSFKALKDLLGEGAAKNLDYIVQDDGSWKVTYSRGGLSKGAGKIGEVVEALVDSNTKVDFGISDEGLKDDGGGKTTVGDSIVVRVSSSAISTANWKFKGVTDTKGGQITFTQSTIVAHELGHAWGAIVDQTWEKWQKVKDTPNQPYEMFPRAWGTKHYLWVENNNRAVEVENYQRERLGLGKRWSH